MTGGDGLALGVGLGDSVASADAVALGVGSFGDAVAARAASALGVGRRRGAVGGDAQSDERTGEDQPAQRE